MSGENDDLKALKCDSCGGDIVKSYRAVDEDEEVPIAKCLNCGMEYDQYSREYYEHFADDFNIGKDNSILKLGLKGTLGSIEYEIIGRIRMQEEDEEEESTWDEWLAVSTDGVYHFFVEEEGEIRSYEEYVPESIDLESSEDYIEFEGKKISKDEGYIGRVVFFEGELTWKPEIGEAVTCYDFKKDGVKYSVEQSEGEVSITRGDRLSYKEIIEAFGDKEDKVLYDNTMKKRKGYRNKTLVYLASFIITLAFSIYSCQDNKPVKGTGGGKKVITNNKIIVQNRKTAYLSQVLYGPFDVPTGNVLYDVNVFVDESVQRLSLEWQSFRFMLIDEIRLNKIINNQFDPLLLKNLFNEIDAQKEPVESFVVMGDFWDERGRDSDGSWHENDLNASSSFVLDKPGKYFAYLELYNNKKRKVESVKFKITEVQSYRYYIIVIVILLTLMIMNKVRASTYNELPFEIAKD